MSIAVVVLAAGQGTRMNSDMPKVMHGLAGAPLLEHALATAFELEPDRVVAVTATGASDVERAAIEFRPETLIARQSERLGTAHAVRMALPRLDGFDGPVVVLYGDTPFVKADTVRAMLEEVGGGAALAVLGFEAEDPASYGRLILETGGELARIVEAKDAAPDELATRLCNSGVMALEAGTLRRLIERVDNANAKGEYYLTDLVGLAVSEGLRAAVITCPEDETVGVNSRADLAEAEKRFQTAARAGALENGATLVDPASVFFSRDTVIGRDVWIGPNVFFGPGVTVESGATIHPFCHLEGCHVSRGAQVGPFARLRPGAELAEDVRVGNFVEVKNAILGEGAKANHLAYLGDASVGERTNIGAGTIFCNYDGVFKHRTEIGPDAFIGSNSALVAPVRIGAEAIVAAGSVVTADVPDGALALARGRQENKPGLARRIMARLRTLKAARARG